ARGAAVVGHRQKQMLDRNERVLQALGFILSLNEQSIEAAGDSGGLRSAAADFRQPLDFAVNANLQCIGRNVGLPKNGGREAVLLVKQGEKDVLNVDLLMTQPNRQSLSVAQSRLGFFSQTIDVHILLPPRQPVPRLPCW